MHMNHISYIKHIGCIIIFFLFLFSLSCPSRNFYLFLAHPSYSLNLIELFWLKIVYVCQCLSLVKTSIIWMKYWRYGLKREISNQSVNQNLGVNYKTYKWKIILPLFSRVDSENASKNFEELQKNCVNH